MIPAREPERINDVTVRLLRAQLDNGRAGLDGGFRRDRRAVTAIEYAIIAGVIVAALVVSVTAIGPSLSNIFAKITPEL